MSIGIIVEARIKTDMIEEIKQWFADNLTDTRNFDGCESISVFSDEEDPTLMFLVERWRAKEDYEKYHHWRVENGSLDQLRKCLDGKPRRNFLNIVS